MLQAGQKVNLTYYEGEDQVESYGWTVQEYDNGLLKVRRPPGEITVAFHEIDKDKKVISTHEVTREWKGEKPLVFNLRSIGFLKVELVE